MALMAQIVPVESLLPAHEVAPRGEPVADQVQLPRITYREEPCRSAMNRVSGMVRAMNRTAATTNEV